MEHDRNIIYVSSVKRGKVSKLFFKSSLIFAIVGLVLILIFYIPRLLAWGKNFKISSNEIKQLENSKNTQVVYEPVFDPSLPKTNHLVIPSIGVDTNIQEATLDNYEEALRNGVWRVSDFGQPGDNIEPIILAAHRFGYLAWTNTYRHMNSFYNLPKVKVGDIIEIDWRQRKYSYEVYALGKGTEITDYFANLILYTCETLTGEERIFVYAKLIY
jgi:sortase (surface protein transpeptidase)